MAALIFILVWHFGKPIFIKSGITKKQRFLTAALAGVLVEVAIFATCRNFDVGSHLHDRITFPSPQKQGHCCKDGTEGLRDDHGPNWEVDNNSQRTVYSTF